MVNLPASASRAVLKQRSMPKVEGPLPDEFRIYEDKAIHGWLEKKKNGYWAAWKRQFITVENQKLCFYVDKSLSTHKGVIDFSKFKARLSVMGEDTFNLSVSIQDGSEKVFNFKTLSKGSLATWITIINMQMSNAEVQLSF